MSHLKHFGDYVHEKVGTCICFAVAVHVREYIAGNMHVCYVYCTKLNRVNFTCSTVKMDQNRVIIDGPGSLSVHEHFPDKFMFGFVCFFLTQMRYTTKTQTVVVTHRAKLHECCLLRLFFLQFLKTI